MVAVAVAVWLGHGCGVARPGRCMGAGGNDEARHAQAFARGAGLTIEPTGAFDVDYVMDEKWMLPGERVCHCWCTTSVGGHL